MECVKVDKQTNWFAAKFKVRNNLSLVNGRQLFNRLKFHNHGIFDDEVQPISFIAASTTAPLISFLFI